MLAPEKPAARPRARITGDAVDVVDVQAGVGDRPQHRLQRQVQPGSAQAAADLRLARRR